jgi:hypothetical protein
MIPIGVTSAVTHRGARRAECWIADAIRSGAAAPGVRTDTCRACPKTTPRKEALVMVYIGVHLHGKTTHVAAVNGGAELLANRKRQRADPTFCEVGSLAIGRTDQSKEDRR